MLTRACRRIAGLMAIVLALWSCSDNPNDQQKPTRSLKQILDSGKLVVLTRNAPSVRYIGVDGEPTGPEHDMVTAFASHLGLEVEFITKHSIKEVIAGVENAEADLAAAGLTITDARQTLFRFGPPYQDVTQQVVCRRANVQPEAVEDLVGLDLVVTADSSYSERLTELKSDHPDLAWEETDTQSTEQLLYRVWQGEIDCTLADSNIVDINRRYFPELIAPLNVGRSQSLAWMMSNDRTDLQEAIAEWFGPFKDSGRLAALQEQYYGFFEVFDYVDARRFMQRIKTRLPKYDDHFKQAAEEYDLPYLLLAAQSYQESHWQPNAKSPTGTRGLMMLTLPTAKAMGVSNRLDPKQSIFGGAKYLARLRNDRFADEVTEPDRTWLALAAYNIGRAHLHDAQTLARELGLSPHTWSDIKQVLPLLTEKRYYKDLKYGYARGTEPVRYVQRIREYQHILKNALNENDGPPQEQTD